MPKMPKWIADTLERVYAGMIVPVEVTETEYITPALKKIVMKGDLSDTKYNVGNVIEFRISEKEFRHYTVSYFDKEKGICEMLIYLHGFGPGSKWCDAVKTGDRLKLLGPGGRIKYNADAKYHFVFGDETSAGLFTAFQHETRKQGHDFFCLAESDDENSHWPKVLHLTAESVPKSFENPAEFAVEKWTKTAIKFPDRFASGMFYLTGRAKSVQAMRKFLVSKGIGMKMIQTEPYWAEGKIGL